MDYLEKMFPQKSDPWNTFPNAKAVIVIAFTNSWGIHQLNTPFQM